MTPETVRYIMAIEAVAAAVQLGAVAGALWFQRGWPMRVALVGAWGVLLYVALGQTKALDRNSPVDVITYIGLGALTLTVAGLLWVMLEKTNRSTGR